MGRVLENGVERADKVLGVAAVVLVALLATAFIGCGTVSPELLEQRHYEVLDRPLIRVAVLPFYNWFTTRIGGFVNEIETATNFLFETLDEMAHKKA